MPMRPRAPRWSAGCRPAATGCSAFPTITAPSMDRFTPPAARRYARRSALLRAKSPTRATTRCSCRVSIRTTNRLPVSSTYSARPICGRSHISTAAPGMKRPPVSTSIAMSPPGPAPYATLGNARARPSPPRIGWITSSMTTTRRLPKAFATTKPSTPRAGRSRSPFPISCRISFARRRRSARCGSAFLRSMACRRRHSAGSPGVAESRSTSSPMRRVSTSCRSARS